MIVRKRWMPTRAYTSTCCIWVLVLLLSFSSAGIVESLTPSPSSSRPQVLRFLWGERTRSSLLIRNMSEKDDDDELSKLIGKRSQIKRKKKENEQAIEDKLLESMEPTVDLDLDKLPAFKTERKVRRPKRNGEEEENGDETTQKAVPDAPIIDYMADYEDENDWHIPNRLAISSVAWGDTSRNFVSSGKLTKRMLKAGKFVAGDVVLGVTELLQAGVTVLETSPSYGDASAQASNLAALDILKQCIEQQQQEGLPEPMIVTQLDGGAATKLKSLVRPGRTMVSSLEQTLQKLDESIVSVFLAPHVPFTPTRLLASGLAAQIESGQAEYVGVTGITSPSTLRRLCKHLEARDCTLTAAAFDFSLTHNSKNGEKLIDACKILNVVPLITDPLDGGLASGVFTATNPSGGQAGVARGKFSFAQLEKLQPLHSVLETVAERVRTRVMRSMRDTQERFKSKYGPPPSINTDITTTQVSLQWVIAKGGVPVPEVNSPAQAKEVLGCLGWTLTDEEVDMLDAAVALCRL